MSELTTPWGALPYYQMHYIVLGNGKLFAEQLVARTRKRTKGFVRKEILDVWWEGGNIVNVLNQDTELESLLKKVLLEEGEIYIDPTENCIRIYSGWKPERKIEISRDALQAYNMIAGHVKKFMSELTVSST
jgi:hypothetical protein